MSVREPAMHPLSLEDQAALDEHLKQAATILKKYTEPEKLNNFEVLEVELRDQLLSQVNPTIAGVFLTRNRVRKSE
jgi:hypothetical protein